MIRFPNAYSLVEAHCRQVLKKIKRGKKMQICRNAKKPAAAFPWMKGKVNLEKKKKDILEKKNLSLKLCHNATISSVAIISPAWALIILIQKTPSYPRNLCTNFLTDCLSVARSVAFRYFRINFICCNIIFLKSHRKPNKVSTQRRNFCFAWEYAEEMRIDKIAYFMLLIATYNQHGDELI